MMIRILAAVLLLSASAVKAETIGLAGAYSICALHQVSRCAPDVLSCPAGHAYASGFEDCNKIEQQFRAAEQDEAKQRKQNEVSHKNIVKQFMGK